MFIFPLLIIVVVALILLDRHERRAKQEKNKGAKAAELESSSPEDYESEADYINHEILAELDKNNPSLERMKNLRARMLRLQNGEVGVTSMETKVESVNGKMVASKIDPITEVANGGGIVAALYAGSLLLLAGVGGLVLSGNEAIGLPLLIMLTVAFYTGGISMRNSVKFKVVSHVFVGTGMVMLPFVGILIHNMTQIDPKIIWLAMSLIGIPVMIYATYIMNNKVFSFFTIAGFVSLSCSLSATMGLSLVWYFILVMVLGIALNMIKMANPSKKLGAMWDAVKVSGEWLPLAALVASIMAVSLMHESDYVILLLIIILQLALNMWDKPSVLWENLLRAAIPVWIVLAIHLLAPTNLAIGIGVLVVATLELICSFLMSAGKDGKNTPRMVIETMWLGIVMISYVAAGILISNFSEPQIWVAILLALLADAAIIVAAQFRYHAQEWYYALLPILIFVPIMLANILKIDSSSNTVYYMAAYLIAILIAEALAWIMGPKKGDAMAIAGLIIFGLAIFIVKPAAWVAAIVFLVAAIGLSIRGTMNKNRNLLEASIYLVAAMVVATITEFLAQSMGLLNGVLALHVIFASLVVTSLIWDNKDRLRIVIGTIGLLIFMGSLALGGEDWVMITFMIEAIMILILGVVLKIKYIWMAGTIALFLSVLWFTRELPFVWPALLGLGLIGAVVIIIWRSGDQKKIK